MSRSIAQTPRLRLRHLHEDDAESLVALLNDPAFLHNIGDRGVRSRDDALRYLAEGPQASYAAHGFGLYAVERREDAAWLGLCGLLRRPVLADVDLGFALLPAYRRCGYTREAADATLAHARADLGLRRLVAITAPHNLASEQLLSALGFVRESRVRLAPEAPELNLFGRAL